MIGFIFLSVLVMAFLFGKSGSPQLAVMGGVYVNATWVVQYQFRDSQKMKSLIKFIITVLLISSLFGFYQWIFGLTYLDLQYLQFGYESGEINIENARPFATYGEAGHFGYAMLFAVALLAWMRERTKDAGKLSFPVSMGFILLIVIASLGVICSFKKAPILSLAVFPIAIFCIRYVWLSIAGLSGLITFIICSILYGDAIRDWCRDTSEHTKEIHPGLTLNTINTRIKSFEQIGDPSSGIKWFGWGNPETHSHTAITDCLLYTSDAADE